MSPIVFLQRDENLGLKVAGVSEKPSVTFDKETVPTEKDDTVPVEQDTEMEVESSKPPLSLSDETAAAHPMAVPIETEVSVCDTNHVPWLALKFSFLDVLQCTPI